jgi:hypothetical protein
MTWAGGRSAGRRPIDVEAVVARPRLLLAAETKGKSLVRRQPPERARPAEDRHDRDRLAP